ncbi:MAG: histidine phosphatase family protein, partial [Pyramidobacter sp.]|nr:histidine phosphatase family protein [Pyramidobacter sp.]
ILVRHGECSANAEGRFRGRMDFPLNDTGMLQAEQTASAIEKLRPAALYSSPLLRAVQTLTPAAQRLGLEITIDDALNNVLLGSWEGRLKKEIAAEFPDLWNQWLNEPENLHFPGMESLTDVARRSRQFIDSLVRTHAGQTIAVCTHRTVLKPLVPNCLGIPVPWFWRFHFDNASISIMLCEQDRGYSLFSLNDTHHLSTLSREWN